VVSPATAKEIKETAKRPRGRPPKDPHAHAQVREFFIDNLLVRIHFIIVMIWWTGLAPWEFRGSRKPANAPAAARPRTRTPTPR